MAKNVLKKRQLSDLGEFGLIDRLTNKIKLKHASSEVGVGDDAAVLDYKNARVVVTTDLLTEGIHFNLIYTPLKHLGYKSAIVNFSDVYAMNAKPKQLLVSIAFSSKMNLEMIEELYAGLHLACDKYGVDLVGGDTSTSLTGLHISITVIGEGNKESLVYRSGAKETDLICVSGDLGGAYLGLQILERERKIFMENPEIQPKMEGYDYILERQLKPEARKDIIEQLESLKIKPTSMIDISDGLSSEMLHLCKASKTGCKIYAEKIPVHPDVQKVAKEMNLETLIAALNGGEDYELLFTVPISSYDEISKISGVSIIGHITKASEGKHIVTNTGQEIEIMAQGWNGIQ
jgi:thiamine-monophosphate kinase